MRGFPNQGGPGGYKGFKPMIEGDIVWPAPKPRHDIGKLKLIHDDDGMHRFLDAPVDSILWHASFYTESVALRVHDYLAKGGRLNDRI